MPIPHSSDDARAATYQSWLHRYNHHRPHTGIDGKTPIDRLRVHNLPVKNSRAPITHTTIPPPNTHQIMGFRLIRAARPRNIVPATSRFCRECIEN